MLEDAIKMLERIRNFHDCQEVRAEELGDYVAEWMPSIREILSAAEKDSGSKT
jgi:hypothetical protein